MESIIARRAKQAESIVQPAGIVDRAKPVSRDGSFPRSEWSVETQLDRPALHGVLLDPENQRSPGDRVCLQTSVVQRQESIDVEFAIQTQTPLYTLVLRTKADELTNNLCHLAFLKSTGATRETPFPTCPVPFVKRSEVCQVEHQADFFH